MRRKRASFKKRTFVIVDKSAFLLVPVDGLEPSRRISPQDFESSASANFTTPAQVIIYHKGWICATIFSKESHFSCKCSFDAQIDKSFLDFAQA